MNQIRIFILITIRLGTGKSFWLFDLLIVEIQRVFDIDLDRRG